MSRTHIVGATVVVLGGLITGCIGQLGGTGGQNTGDDTFVVFQDPDSNFSTTDVWDVEEQTVRFDRTANTMVWIEDNSEFPGWETTGNFLGAAQNFQVRFGTKDGQRRAYFTETATATICDIEGGGGLLSIFPTAVTVPQ